MTSWIDAAAEEIAGDPSCCDIQSSDSGQMAAIIRKHYHESARLKVSLPGSPTRDWVRGPRMVDGSPTWVPKDGGVFDPEDATRIAQLASDLGPFPLVYATPTGRIPEKELARIEGADVWALVAEVRRLRAMILEEGKIHYEDADCAIYTPAFLEEFEALRSEAGWRASWETQREDEKR